MKTTIVVGLGGFILLCVISTIALITWGWKFGDFMARRTA